MRKILTLTLLLLSITYAQAQDWINNESTLLYEQTMQTDENTQCIEVYDPKHILTTTNKSGTSHYVFRLWKNGSAIFEGFLADSNCVISDIEIFDDSVYFCGTRDVNGNQVGYIGRFSIQQFFNNQNCGYEIMNIPTSSKIKKMVAYETFGKDHIVAIGMNNFNSSIIIDLFPDSVCNIFYNNLFPYENLCDIAVGDKFINIVGEDTGSANISINKFYKYDLLSNANNYQYHYKYNYSSIAGLVPIIINEEQVKISFVDNSQMAITTSAIGSNGNSFYTLVSILNEHTLNILKTFAIPHNDKNIKIKDTEYDNEAEILYILEDNNLDSLGYFESYIFPLALHLQNINNFNAIKNIRDYKINDIVYLGLKNKFVGVGISYDSYQGLFAKDISSALNNCNILKYLKPLLFLGQIPMNSVALYNVNTYSINWNQKFFNGSTSQQIVECQ
jgi:hypothetical protein